MAFEESLIEDVTSGMKLVRVELDKLHAVHGMVRNELQSVPGDLLAQGVAEFIDALTRHLLDFEMQVVTYLNDEAALRRQQGGSN